MFFCFVFFWGGDSETFLSHFFSSVPSIICCRLRGNQMLCCAFFFFTFVSFCFLCSQSSASQPLKYNFHFSWLYFHLQVILHSIKRTHNQILLNFTYNFPQQIYQYSGWFYFFECSNLFVFSCFKFQRKKDREPISDFLRHVSGVSEEWVEETSSNASAGLLSLRKTSLHIFYN